MSNFVYKLVELCKKFKIFFMLFGCLSSSPSYSPSGPNTLHLRQNPSQGHLFPCINGVKISIFKCGCCKTKPTPNFNLIWNNETLIFHCGRFKLEVFLCIDPETGTEAFKEAVSTKLELRTSQAAGWSRSWSRGYCRNISAFSFIYSW